jgi:hypothetical protein
LAAFDDLAPASTPGMREASPVALRHSGKGLEGYGYAVFDFGVRDLEADDLGFRRSGDAMASVNI